MSATRPPEIPQRVQTVIRTLLDRGATECMVVGGWVRDHLLGIDSKDIDLEVYGLGYDQIVAALRPRWRVNLVGKSFGVVKVGDWLDINIPRRESKHGIGHRGFSIDADPTMTPYEATARRDFTINAIGLRLDGTFHDPFDGRGDILRGVLRATTEAYKEDPLRVLRGMQFASRFGFAMDARTIAMSREIADEFEHLSAERVWEEWQKWALKGAYPAAGLHLLQATGWIENFPELAATVGARSRLSPSTAGDLFLATCAACDRAAARAVKVGMESRERISLMLAALTHGLGAESAAEFLLKMRAPGWVVERVRPLVAEHATPLSAAGEQRPTESDARRLAHRLQPATVRLWAVLADSVFADVGLPASAAPVAAWRDAADRLGLLDQAPRAILQGRHLLERGFGAGPTMGRILREAFEAQLDGAFTDLDGALQWLTRHSAD